MKVIVPDTGVLIDGRITEMIQKEEEASSGPIKIVVSHSSLAELEYQANVGRETGFAGLQELKRLSEMAKTQRIVLEFTGERPNAFEIEHARFGEIDSKIRATARQLSGTLLTTDKVQREVAAAEGIPVIYLEPIVITPKLSLQKYFSSSGTMSVHLKEGVKPKAKIGRPGEFVLQEIGDKPLLRKEIEFLVREALEYSKRMPNSFVEIDKTGATVLQIGDYRITYTKPPFSEAVEATIVRPLVKLYLDDYKLSPQLRARISEKAEGIVIAGPPGSGKSTFATAVAEYYAKTGKIVKTLESPRDLQVSTEITQYAPLEDSFASAADILLLVRPDYTIFDEVRKQEEFTVFSDLRLAGIGMLGVVHASKPIDAIQRFIGKVELGMIPQIVDTVVFIAKGQVQKVFTLTSTVRTPSGMMERDLARPLIEVRDFKTGALEYELYTWGEETVVAPVGLNRLQTSKPAFDNGGGYRDRRPKGKWRKR
jgi:ATPase